MVDKKRVVELEGQGKTLAEASEELGVSRERVRQLFKRATGFGWGTSRKQVYMSPEALVISVGVAEARKARDVSALIDATLEIQNYATKRSWLIAEASYAWGVVQPYGGYVTLSKMLRMEPGTLRNYARTYKKFARLARKYPEVNFSFYHILSGKKLEKGQAEELIKMVIEEELTISQFKTMVEEVLGKDE